MSQSYKIEPVLEKDVEDVMALLKRTFFLDEPLNATVGLCANNERCTEVEEYCEHSLLEGLSFKAVDNEGNIISVMINGVAPVKEEDNGNDLLSKAKRCSNPKFQKILYILARRQVGHKLWERFPKEQNLVEVKVAATDPGWRRKGLMNELLAHTERAVVAHGYRLLRIDTSSYYSALSAEKLGFTCVYKARYADMKMDGEPLIVPPPPHEEDRVYVKLLTT